MILGRGQRVGCHSLGESAGDECRMKNLDVMTPTSSDAVYVDLR